MSFGRYCKDKWISIIIMLFILVSCGFLLVMLGVIAPLVCVGEMIYAMGYIIILIQDYLARREFYGKVLEATDNLRDTAYLSQYLEEPYFLEGQFLCRILKQDEKYLNDQIAAYEREVTEYKEYVELWAHEIKTPVAVSRLIMENHRDDTTKSLSEEMDKLENYVEQMIYYSKGNSVHNDYRIRPVMLKTLVMDAVKKNAKIIIANQAVPKFENLDIEVLTDAKWMEYILSQIILNAVKYHAMDRKPEIVFRAARRGNEVLFAIEDNGIGIPAEDLSRVVYKGFTGENGRNYSKSTGMGLYICDTLCRKLGTELVVESEQGKGTTISLIFQKCNITVR